MTKKRTSHKARPRGVASGIPVFCLHDAGKTPTAREQTILDSAGTQNPEGFLFNPETDYTKLRVARTWDELAAALSVDERTLYNFRKAHSVEIHRLSKPPTPKSQLLTHPDGRHVVANWRNFADAIGELKGRGINSPDSTAINERDLRLRERLLEVERAELRLAQQKREVLPLTEYQDALRILVGAFDTVLRQLPGRTAERIVEAARQSMLGLARAEFTDKQFEKIKSLLAKAPCDHAAIAQILTDAIESCRRILSEADFLHPPPDPEADTPAAECPTT